MTKKKKIFISITSLFLVAILAICIIFKTDNHLYYYFYTAPRVIINLHINIDGEDVIASPDETANKNIDYEEDMDIISDIKFETKANYSVLSLKNVTYGPFSVPLTINDIDLILQGYLFNSWDVQHINLYVEIDTENQTVSHSEMYTFISEEDGYTEKSVTKPTEKSIYTDNIKIPIGTLETIM